MDKEILTAEVGPEHAGQRFDQALVALFPQYSRSRLAQWIKDGRARLDGKPAKPRQLVAGGERVELEAVADAAVEMAPEAISLEVLVDDPQLLIVNKPVGLVVHPGAGNPRGTLQNALLHYDARLATLPRAGIVHRLDRETSGALLIARTLEAHAALVAALAARAIKRQYEAVVNGMLVAGGTVDAPIARHPRDRVKMAVVEDGKHAVTHYRVRERFRAHSVLQVNLETGRTHQIRVHMAHIRHPLVGDSLYGPGLKLPRGATTELADQLRGFKRQALHAERLELAHPKTGKTIVAEAPRPPDLAALIAALRDDDKRAAAK
jgi:23S rRNA pseudouridine1911/1915/1917 synthase